MFNTSIKKAVMAHINTIIKDVQARYDAQVEAIEREAEVKKMEARELAVESIVGKFK